MTSHTAYWMRIFGISKTEGYNDDTSRIANALDKVCKYHEPKPIRTFEDHAACAVVTFTTESMRDAVVKAYMGEIHHELILKYPIRVGKEEWSYPCDQEALMVLSTKGIPA